MRELRLQKLQDVLRRDGSIQVDAVAAELDVSRETIRRDLTTLADKGLAVRTHGGATAPGTSITERALSVRVSEQHDEKVAIAKYVAAHLVDDGISLSLDTGTTTAEIARAIRGRRVTVVTTCLLVINTLADSDTDVVVIGGHLRRMSEATVGPMTVDLMGQFQVDLAILSAPAISLHHGFMDSDLDGAAVKQAMLTHARTAYAVMDHTKLERTAFTKVCAVEDLTGVVTDAGADRSILDDYSTAGVDVQVAPMVG
jgi:DeoR/GlpR family transcriptional regulator of sugar metabolism